MSETECKHGLESQWCSICLHGIEVPNKRKVDPAAPLRPISMIDGHSDPEERLAMRVAAGEVCPRCLGETGHKQLDEPVTEDGWGKGRPMSIVGRGCPCSRRRLYDEDLADGQDFLAQSIDESMLTPREAAGMATSSQRRGGRYASLTPDEAFDERVTVLQRFKIDPRWFAARRHEQDHRPV